MLRCVRHHGTPAYALRPQGCVTALTHACTLPARRSTYETSPLKLFLGERGQHGLATHWWHVDAANAIKGPYTAEQMLMAVVASRELDMETLVCGTSAEVKPPLAPSSVWFEPLHEVLSMLDIGGHYLPVGKQEAGATTGASRVSFAPALPAVTAAPISMPGMVAPRPMQVQAAMQMQQPRPPMLMQGAGPPMLQQMMAVRPGMPMQPGMGMQAAFVPHQGFVAPGAFPIFMQQQQQQR